MVSIEQRVRPISLSQFAFGDGVGQPSVMRLASKLQYPTRDRDGYPVRGQLAHKRVEPFPGKSACDKDAAQRSTSFSCSKTRLRLRRSRRSADSAAVAPGRNPASISAFRSQFREHVCQIPTSCAISLIATPTLRRWTTATTSSRNSFGKAFGLIYILPAAPHGTTSRCI